jgi:hypothetical protein
MVYHVAKEHVATKRRLARVVLVVAITLVGTYALRTFLHWRTPVGKLEAWDIIPCVITALFDSGRNSFDLEVNDNSIQTHGGFVFANYRSVRRGHIHYFYEFHGDFLREPALILSEHGALTRFFFGTVVIPATLPQYEEIKQTALTWREIA